MFCVLFSDSLALSASIALFFVPKDPLGSDFGPKHNFKKKLGNLSNTRSAARLGDLVILRSGARVGAFLARVWLAIFLVWLAIVLVWLSMACSILSERFSGTKIDPPVQD